MSINGKPFAIIGAGLAGLTAANYLKRNAVPFVLFEAGPKIAGLASSFKDDEGFSYDFGAHFVTNRLAAAIGVSADCRVVHHYSETVWLKGKSYGYPFGLMSMPRFSFSAMVSRLKRKTETETAADYFRGEYGNALADEVALPLLEAWSGAPANELSASVGNKLANSIVKTLWLKLAGKISRRAIACGYSHEMPESANVWHVYPNGGISTLCKKLADGLDANIKLESPVESIVIEDNRAAKVRVKGEEIEVAGVISTAPINILAKLVKGTDALKSLHAFRYRPMVFVNLRFEGRGLLPDVVTWTPEKHFPFFRLTEATLSMPWLAPEGKTLITADIGCEVGDEIWTKSDDELGELCLRGLEKIIPNAREKYKGCRVLKTPIAYPVYLAEYEAKREEIEKSLGIEGLISIGRNGEFAHILMEDVYWRTLKRMRLFVRENQFPTQIENAKSIAISSSICI